MNPAPRIAIIGGGPAGLTLARLLEVARHKVDYTVYELDASATFRVERGGTLDLHADTGLAAIKKAGLWKSFLKYARYDGQEMKIADKNGTVVVHIGGGRASKMSTERPEIDRHRLREILLDSLPSERIMWGRKLKEVTADGRLRFDGRAGLDGPFDLVVGADGAWSKVRARLNGDEPFYSGVSGYEMDVVDASTTCPAVDKQIGAGSYGLFEDGKMLGGQRLGDGTIKVRIWQACEQGALDREIATYGRQGALDKALARCKQCNPKTLQMYKAAEVGSLHPWTLYQLPVGSKWDHHEGFTLIGDAASLMTPFAGEGVNKAMRDSMELAECIDASLDPANNMALDEAVQCYETAMFPRSAKVQADTHNNKHLMFEVNKSSPVTVLPGMVRHMTGTSDSFWVRWLGAAPIIALLQSYLWMRVQLGVMMLAYARGMSA